MLRYNPNLKTLARNLRVNLTDSEQRLWSRVRRKQILGVPFYRQKPLGNYIADFYAPKVNLVIEIDGSQHLEPTQVAHDQQRTAYLERQGLRVLRFATLEVLQELEAVTETIYRAVQDTINPPNPLYQRGDQKRQLMTQPLISAHDPYLRHRIKVLDSEMAYVDVGSGDPIVFLHGNPTSSYLWRNVIPHVEGRGRCLAPDLIGMGDSGKNPSGAYRLVDHARYLDAWFEALGLSKNVTLVVHDWGSALGFSWAQRHPERVNALAYMEAIVRPLTWEEWPEAATKMFKVFRSPDGEAVILQKNVFVERILPASVLRGLTPEEMAVYRRPYLEPGESRRPTLTWPRQIPISGEPADVVALVESYSKWLATSGIPKLFINAEPGMILVGTQRDLCRTWSNQQEVTVTGLHFIQEDSPVEIGQAIAKFIEK
jgi:haloalkane dehalogenase